MTSVPKNSDAIELETDVLIVGGGMAATWAAISAARSGAEVVLVDKGYVGTSGVTATGGPGHWWVPPDPEKRRQAIEKRLSGSFGLADPAWMERIIDLTWRILPTLGEFYDFSTDDPSAPHFQGVRGPEYMRALRRMSVHYGVRILDQSPAIELLLHTDGAVAGARGVQRMTGQAWAIRSAAVVLATGGCAFRSGLIGSHANTGDGHLMAAEAGAELSGMEFSSFHTVSPAWLSMRTAIFMFARYYDADDRELDLPALSASNDFTNALARALQAGPVFCRLEDVPEQTQKQFPQIQPASLLPFVRKGIDPYRDKFEVALFGEGTVRGTGGLHLVDDQCQTTVPGLFAAGDVSSRELVAGAASGGGAQNSSWALSSGLWAGAAGAAMGRRLGRRTRDPARGCGTAALHPTKSVRSLNTRDIVASAQQETLPFDKILFRTEERSNLSLKKLDTVWNELRSHGQDSGRSLVSTREAAALLQHARWCHSAAAARKESRGLHQRLDRPAPDPAFERRLRVGGIDDIWVR